MKIKIGFDDSLRDKISDEEQTFLALLEDDFYFRKKKRELDRIYNEIKNEQTNNPPKTDNIFSPLYDLEKYINYEKYLEKLGKLCTEYNLPFETIFSIRMLIEKGYWLPIKKWQIYPLDIVKYEDIDSMFDTTSIFIKIDKDVGITELNKYLRLNYLKISNYFGDKKPEKYQIKKINQPNIEINKRVYKLRNQKPKLSFSDIAETINRENIRAHYTNKTINTLYKDYLKSIRNLRK